MVAYEPTARKPDFLQAAIQNKVASSSNTRDLRYVQSAVTGKAGVKLRACKADIYLQCIECMELNFLLPYTPP